MGGQLALSEAGEHVLLSRWRFWAGFDELGYWSSLSLPWLVEIHQCSSLGSSLPFYFFLTFAKPQQKPTVVTQSVFTWMLVTASLTVEGPEHTLLLLELAEW